MKRELILFVVLFSNVCIMNIQAMMEDDNQVLVKSLMFINKPGIDKSIAGIKESLESEILTLEEMTTRLNTYVDSKLGATALWWAVNNQFNDVVKQLIEWGADVNKASITGITPLMTAVRNDNTDVLTLLIEKGADVNAVNDAGQTALDLARPVSQVFLQTRGGKTSDQLRQEATTSLSGLLDSLSAQLNQLKTLLSGLTG